MVLRFVNIPRLLATSALTIAVLVPGIAQTPKPCGSVDRATTALRLTSVLYPELAGREVSLSFSSGNGSPLNTPTDADDIGISIDRPQWHRYNGNQQLNEPEFVPLQSVEKGPLELPLYLEFSFIVTKGTPDREILCHPIKFIDHTSNKQMHQAEDLIDSHPEWSDAQDIQAAVKFGMRFGPDKKAQLLRLIPLSGLSAFYGPLRIAKAEFSITGEKAPNSSFANPYWEVTLQEVGSNRTLLMGVDPFNGRIISVGE